MRISNRLYNGTTPLDTLPAHMIERIEIIEGGEGLFYGTQAVAGVINVVTKAFSENTDGRVQSAVDTNRGGHINAFARDTVQGHRFVLYGSKDQAKGFQPFPDIEYQPSTTDRRRSYDVNTFGGKYSRDFSNEARFSAMYQLSNVKLDFLSRPARSSASQVGGVSTAFNERVEHITSAKLDYTPRENVQLFFKGYYHQWDSHYSERRNVIGAPGKENLISDREFWGFKDYGANLLAKIAPTRSVEYFAGYDFQNYSGRDEVLLIAPKTEPFTPCSARCAPHVICSGKPHSAPVCATTRPASRSGVRYGMSAAGTTSQAISSHAPISARRSDTPTPTSCSRSIRRVASAIRI